MQNIFLNISTFGKLLKKAIHLHQKSLNLNMVFQNT